MKNTSLRNRMVCLLLCCVMLIPMAVALPASAAETGSLIDISFNSPAIGADVGQEIDLTQYRVPTTATAYMEQDGIVWSSDDVKVENNRVKATAKGVYALTAKRGYLSKTVYLVVKEPQETEYVLYETDFSDAAVLSDWKKLQQTSGASYSVSNGELILDASADKSQYIRLMLPAFLNDFGDYHYEATGTITKAANDSRWMSLMFRIQKNNYPYYQLCVRQNATTSNGTEFAERTEKDAWNVTHTKAYTEKLSSSKNYTLAVDVAGANVATSINGERLLWTPTATKYTKGGVGLQVNGCRAEITSLKVTLMIGEVEATASKLAQVREPESNLKQTPSIVSYVEDLNTIMTNSPATAILRINSALDVLDAKGNKIGTVEQAIKTLNKKAIPAFYVKDEATVKAICDYLEKQEIVDAFVMAADEALVRKARDTYSHVFSIVDWSGRSDVKDMTMADIRAKTNAAGARVAVIPASLATAANVEALQRLFITVWVQSEKDDTVELVSHITSGANGIVTQNRAELERCFTAYFSANTITRVVNVIGHRGQPSTGQENSIASSVEAYEAGATMIENDIYISTDGVIVVMHDSTIDRTTNGSGNVESMPVATLQKFVIDGNTAEPTQPIPTLEDYLKEFRGKDVQLIIEIKSGKLTLLAPMVELLKKYDMVGQANIITFKADQIVKLKELYPELSIGYLTSGVSFSEDEPLSSVEQILEIVQTYETTFNPSYASGALGPNVMKAAWHRGITFWPYTINKVEDFDTYFMYGANGITTNYSYWVKDYLKNVTTEQSAYTLAPGEQIDLPILRTTYGRATDLVTTGAMTVISGNPDALSYRNGQLKATEAGEYTVIFRHASALRNGSIYYMYSQPVTISVKSEDVTPAETTPALTTPTDPQPTDPEQGTDGSETAMPAGAIVAIVAAVAVVSTAVVLVAVFRSKAKKK